MAALSEPCLILVFALSSVIYVCQCASYKQVFTQHGDHPVHPARVARIKLARGDRLDSFEALSQSHSSFRNEHTEARKPFGLNSHLVGSVGIGNPVQEFKFVFDTVYANMWIPSLNCSNCGAKKRYNSSASSTHIDDGTFIQTGWDSGFRSIDQVSFGDVVIKNQTFAEMTRIQNNFEGTPYDGLFCLGYDFTAQEDVVTPLRQMLNQKLIDHEVFSIYQNSTGGEIVFGGFDTNHFEGLISWLPNADLVDWSFRMDSMTLKQSEISKEVTVCKNGCKVNIYTYYPYIIGPPDEVMLINQAMGAQVDEDDDSIFVLPNCDLSKLANLVFTINFTQYEFKPEQYVQRVEKAGKVICVSSLHAVNLMFPQEWFIGSSVIGHIYTAFDYENRLVGFAHTK